MRRRLATMLAVGALLTGMLATSGIVLAANQAANLDQCANDPAPSLPTNGCSGAAGETGWVNGNLGASKSIYREGDSIAYRMRFTNLATTGPAHTVIIEWDTTKAGKHAIDYLTTWNRTVANADPKLGVSPAIPGAPSTRAIPVDSQVKAGPNGTTPNGDDINPGPDGTPGTADDSTLCATPNVPCTGVFTLWGGSITSVSGITYPDGPGFAGDKTARLTVSFTASVANPVLAWGGHIATRQNWPGASAINISGSPYHMRLIDLDGAGGNQDRSLSADAVVFPGSITIIKDTDPNNSQNFGFTTTGGLTPSTFTLDDDGDPTLSNTQVFSNIINFTTYTVSETATTGWDLTNRVCSISNPNGGSAGASGTTAVSINLKEGESVTCTFTNRPTPAPHLSIDKVDNTGGFDSVGDVISYTITATNDGNVALTNVTVTDSQVSDLSCVPTIPVASLAVGGQIICSASHTITQADLDAGSFYNQACVDDGAGGAAQACDNTTTTGTPDPSLSIDKVDNTGGFDSVGDVISYTITATNDGNVTLHNVVVTDAQVSDLSCTPTTPVASLAPGDSIVCTASHTITQADLDAGSFYNQACTDDGASTGNPGGDGNPGADAICDNTTTTGTQNPVLTLTKTDNLNPAKYEGAGVVITYTITATNSGNVTLHNVTVSDDPVLDGFSCLPTIPVASLAPGDSIVCTGTHTTTAADVTAGFFKDTASASSDEDDAPDADDTVYGKAQPTITTVPSLQVRDAVTIGGLVATPTFGNLTVKLVNGADCNGATLFTQVWYGHDKPVGGNDFTGNGTYTTDWVSVSADATLRWCSAYEGDADNAARAFADDDEVIKIDFFPLAPLAGAAFGFAIPLLAFAMWRRRSAAVN